MCRESTYRIALNAERMDRTRIRTVFVNRAVCAAFLLILGVYFVPPLLTGGQLLFDSAAAPVWNFAVESGHVLGCGSLSCVPLFLGLFLAYTYLLAVLLATLYREAPTLIQRTRIG